MNELVQVRQHGADVEAYRASTEAAEICKGIVLATSSNIQGRKYVSVEGWQAIAVAHGCAAGARDVERVNGGVRAIGEVRRMSDGQLIATAEGFVGEDEATWFGGDNGRGRVLPKRPDYAIRAMAQTRAISRACRSAFAHVVVMMNAGLATTPAEEITYDVQTGEVIEADPARREPVAREKLDGPHTSKTALRKAVHDVIAKARNAASIRELDAIKEEHKHTINQARRDWPALIEGDPDIEEDVGLKGVFAAKREELTPPERSLQYNMLVSCLNECTSSNELQAFINKHGEAVGELDGEESRLFEILHDEKAAALKQLDTVTTGG